MNLTDSADLLMLVAAYDQRTVGEADVIAWQQVLYDVTLPNAKAAVVDHYRTSTDRIMPAHVRQGVKRVRQAALQNAEEPTPPFELCDRPHEYNAWLVEWRKATADAACEPTRAIAKTSLRPQLGAGNVTAGNTETERAQTNG